jgi:hypothetical protein
MNGRIEALGNDLVLRPIGKYDHPHPWLGDLALTPIET